MSTSTPTPPEQPVQERPRRRRLVALLAALVLIAAGAGAALLILGGDDKGSSFDKEYRVTNDDLQQLEDDVTRTVTPAASKPDAVDAQQIAELERRADELRRMLDELEPPDDLAPRVDSLSGNIARLRVRLDELERTINENDPGESVRIVREILVLVPALGDEGQAIEDDRPSAGPTPATGDDPAPVRPSAQQLELGQPATLGAVAEDRRPIDLRVQVESVERIEVPASQQDRVGAETLAAVRATVTNLGGSSYSSFKASDVVVGTRGGRRAEGAIGFDGPPDECATTYLSSSYLTLDPGARQTYCIAYRLPEGDSPAFVRWTPKGGRGAAEWRVGG